MKITSIIILFSALILSACSMTVPETKIYSIHTSGREIQRQSGNDRVLIVQVSSADYLRQPFIAKRTSLYEMVLDKNAKWEASPVRIVSDELATAAADSGLFSEVSQEGVSDGKAFVMTVYLRNFDYLNNEGSGAALLNFDLSLQSPEGDLIFRENIEMKRPFDPGDNGSLARELSNALGEAADMSVQKIAEKFD